MAQKTKTSLKVIPGTQQLQPRPKSAAGTSYTEPTGMATVGWDPAKIKLAERLADGGDLTLASDLITAMRGDDRFCGVLETLGGVCSLPMKFESGSRNVKPEKDPAC